MTSQVLERFKEYINAARFNAIRIGIASPEKIKALSYGEVKKIETINYRTLKPERDGLFCARIFGPMKDWECNCGKYKRMKHRGVTCEKCGVEVIQSRVRRERMGHIQLVAPVVHIWFFKGIPSYLSIILDMSVKDLERVIYFDAYVVIRQGKSPYPAKTLLSWIEYLDYMDNVSTDSDFFAEIGAEAILHILKNIDLAAEINFLKSQYLQTTSSALRSKLSRRTKVLNDLLKSQMRPDWMVMTTLPVLPPDLRPLVAIDGGRFASSDLNDLYRRVLNRNIRLRRLIEIDAPTVIIKNEKRMLQESVDALIDNGRRGQVVRGSNKRPLKSLSEMLRGKQGRFRQNLLGRRVDYSGRSVIVVDPELRIDQCGLPKMMALELFKPYVYEGLLQREHIQNMRVARRLVDELAPEIWDVLEEVVANRPVLLNRAPTLHRLGIQAFFPILVDGKAIKVHPLVCHAFNADFDGDQMAVHVPLSERAQLESKLLILSSKNVLSPANGRPLPVPSQDMVLGLYYLTKIRAQAKGSGLVFPSINHVITAYQSGSVDLHAQIKVRMALGDLVLTTVGRVILYDALPKGSDFGWVNKIMNKSDLAKMVEKIYYDFGPDLTVLALDRIKKLGFSHATSGGISIAISNLMVPVEKADIVNGAEKEVLQTEALYMDGVITNGERYNKILSVWYRATANIASAMYNQLEQEDQQSFYEKDKPFNPVFMMLDSGARGTRDQIKQLVGMRGCMAKPNGEIMETPVKSNFKEGLSVFEYFISTHGARKGQSDTALKTANSGYLTRCLVDVAHDVVITTDDCQTLGFIEMEDLRESGDVICPLAERVFGRVVAADVKDLVTGELIFSQGDIVEKHKVARLADAAVNKIAIRSVLTCQAKQGVCAKCYGYDLSKSELVTVGTTVGIIAAQSIGEPGTQLTMRTFHIGGTASGFGEQSQFIAKHQGIIQFRGVRIIKTVSGVTKVLSRKAHIVIVSQDGRELQDHLVDYGSTLFIVDGEQITVGQKIAEWDPNNRVLLTEFSGIVSFVDLIENVTYQDRFDEATKKSNYLLLETRGEKYQPALGIIDTEKDDEVAHYFLPAGGYLQVVNGQKVQAGDVLVKIPREASKTKDITGGLPRIKELFEARAPKDIALIADIDGEVVIGGLHRGLRKVSVISGSETYDYFVQRGKQLNVVNGERVSAGDLLTTGLPVLQDMLRILGPDYVQRYLVDQVEQIYRLQGVSINAKHYELIVRQMMRKVKVVDAGDSEFIIGSRVDKIHFQTMNSLLRAAGKRPALARPILMGITQASLGTESFISAASFQETTRILSEVAIAGGIDMLLGLKENVIVGKLIPAGTGVKSFAKKYFGDNGFDLEQQARKQEHILKEQLKNNKNIQTILKKEI